AVALALGARPASSLPALVAAARAAGEESEGREADLWRAIGIMAREAPAGEARAAAAAAIARRLASGRGYELRYRLIEAAGALGEPAIKVAISHELTSPAACGATTLVAAEATAL